MRRVRTTVAATMAVATLAGLAGCGGSSNSSGPNKADFCAANHTLDKATANVSGLSGLVSALKDNQSTLDDFIKQAPAAIKDQAQVLASAANSAIKTGKADSFQTPKLASAGNAVDSYCGQASSNP